MTLSMNISIRTPGHEEELLLLGAFSGSLTLMFILKVIETIATFSFASSLKVSQEVIIGSITSSHLLNGDELLILDEEDTVTVGLVLLDLLKDILTVISNCYS